MNKHVQKALTLSIVIPAYNEAVHLGTCLNSIAAQTTMPDEVIVVDNNSTDNTSEIANSFDFVTVVIEKHKGVIAARNRGFNESKSDIIGRIDADSVLSNDWVDKVKRDFEDKDVCGTTGLGETRVLIGLGKWYSTFWSRAYFWTAHAFFDSNTMWGANMAIRCDSWSKVGNLTSKDGELVHEDQDLSLVLIGNGCKIIQDNELRIKTTGGGYLYWPKFWKYFKKAIRTKKYHNNIGTLADNNPLRIGIWKSLPGAVIGWGLLPLFIVYSLMSWPIIRTLLIFNKDLLVLKR